MRKFLVAIVLLAAIVAAGLGWLLANPNQFKPQIAEVIRHQTGLRVVIGGDLSWRLWPQLRLEAHDLSADWHDNAEKPLFRVANLSIKTALSALVGSEPRLNVEGVELDGAEVWLIEDGNGANWTPPNYEGPTPPPIPVITAPLPAPKRPGAAPLTLGFLQIRDGLVRYRSEATYDITLKRAQLQNFRFGAAAPLEVEAVVSDGVDSHAIRLAGTVTAADNRFELDAHTLETTLADGAGTLVVETARRPRLSADWRLDRLQIPGSEDNTVAFRAIGGIGAFPIAAAAAAGGNRPILPLATLRAVDWQAHVAIAELHIDNETFHDVDIRSSGESAELVTSAELQELYGGRASLKIAIDATRSPPVWRVNTDLQDVDSRRLVDRVGSRLHWVAPLLLAGEVTMQGNTERQLIGSVQGELDFDGGRGELDIRQLRGPTLALADLVGRSEQIAAWPDIVDYRSLLGTWRIDGQDHLIDIALDNLSVNARGEIDPMTEVMDLVATITFAEEAEHVSLPVDPVLTNLPIPVRCRGSLAQPTCELDDDGAKKLVGKVLRGEGNSELRATIDKKIEQHVPEEHRDAARQLLETLGRLLDEQ